MTLWLRETSGVRAAQRSIRTRVGRMPPCCAEGGRIAVAGAVGDLAAGIAATGAPKSTGAKLRGDYILDYSSRN